MELPLGPALWESVFTVAPLVLVGTKEADGWDFAPKHMAMPLGWAGFYCFACTPEHATYRNVQAHPQFTVSFPQPDQILTSSFAAGGRTESDAKPTLAAVPTAPARVVDGRVVEGCLLYLECELERIVDGFGPNSLDRRPGGGRSRCSRGAARRRGGRRRPRASPRAARAISPPVASPSCATASRSPSPPTSGASPMPATAAGSLLDWLRRRRPEMVDLLERLARAESPTLEPETQRGPFRILAAELERDGLVVSTGPGDRGGRPPLRTARAAQPWRPAPAADRPHGHRLARRHARRDAAPRGGRAALRPRRRGHEGRSGADRVRASRVARARAPAHRHARGVRQHGRGDRKPRLEPLHPPARARRRPGARARVR